MAKDNAPRTPAAPHGLRIVALDAATDAARGPHVATVPGEAVPLVQVELPDRLGGLAREQVARRAWRDMTGQDAAATELRPFIPGGGRAGWTRMLAADAAALRDWRAQAAARPGCRAVLPDYLTLPAAPAVWVLRQAGGRLLARLGVEDGFSADTALAGRLLRARQAQDRPRAVLAEGVDTALLDPLRAADLPILDDPAGLAALGLSEPRVLAHGELAHDLRRDPQLSRATARRAVIGWGLPACLALLGFALWMAAVQVETARLSAAAEEARAAALATTRAVFVPDGPILDIRAQVSRTLEAAQRPDPADGGAEADPVLLFKRAASVVAGGGASVDRVDYAAGQGLGLEVTVASFAALDTLADALRADGLRVEVGEADVAAPSLAEGDTPTGVRARLILSADGGQP